MTTTRDRRSHVHINLKLYVLFIYANKRNFNKIHYLSGQCFAWTTFRVLFRAHLESPVCLLKSKCTHPVPMTTCCELRTMPTRNFQLCTFQYVFQHFRLKLTLVTIKLINFHHVCTYTIPERDRQTSVNPLFSEVMVFMHNTSKFSIKTRYLSNVFRKRTDGHSSNKNWK